MEDTDNEIVSELTGSWYFTPDMPKEWYLRSTTDGVMSYSPELAYARYGHWLSEVESGAAVVNTYAATGATGTITSGLAISTVGDELVGTATYTGDARGYSLHKTVDEDGETTSIYSGAFTADVSLVARFGTAATLGGTIKGFEGGAVDTDWSVELERITYPDSGTITAGKTVASGRDGEWTATSYGEAEQRPTGIFGGFNSHFSDGHAAGAYATRK